MATNASILDAGIPLSVKPVNIDVAGNMAKGFDMRGKMVEERHTEEAYGREDQDRSVLDEYMKHPDANLSTLPGAQKALSDLKGKVSSDTYLKLDKHAKSIEQGDLKFRTEIASLDESNLKTRSQQMEKTLTYLAQPIDAYEKTLGTKGKPDADAEFAKARSGILQAAGQEKSADGKPLYPADMLQGLANADPATLKAMLHATKYHKDMVDERFKESQIKRNDALAGYDDERRDVLKQGGSLGGSQTEFAKLDADLNAGRISQEEHDKIKAGIVAKKGAPGDVSGLSEDAISQAGTNYYLTHELPARLSPAERTKILNSAAAIAKENGDSAEETTARAAAGKSAKVAITDITKRKALVSTFEKDADKRLGLILEISKRVDQSKIPALNRWINAGKQNIAGDEDVNLLNSTMISLQAELAKVLSGSLGNAGVSDSARAEAGQIVNKYMSPGQIDSLVPNIRRELKFKMDSYDEELKDLNKNLTTPNKNKTDADHQKVGKEAQGKLDSDAKTILMDEYRDKVAKLATIDSKSPTMADVYSRAKEDVAAIKRELEKIGVKNPESGSPAPVVPKAGVPTDAEVADILKKHGAQK